MDHSLNAKRATKRAATRLPFFDTIRFGNALPVIGLQAVSPSGIVA